MQTVRNPSVKYSASQLIGHSDACILILVSHVYTNIGLPRAGEISSTAACINNGEFGHNARVIFRIVFCELLYLKNSLLEKSDFRFCKKSS